MVAVLAAVDLTRRVKTGFLLGAIGNPYRVPDAPAPPLPGGVGAGTPCGVPCPDRSTSQPASGHATMVRATHDTNPPASGGRSRRTTGGRRAMAPAWALQPGDAGADEPHPAAAARAPRRADDRGPPGPGRLRRWAAGQPAAHPAPGPGGPGRGGVADRHPGDGQHPCGAGAAHRRQPVRHPVHPSGARPVGPGRRVRGP